MLRKFAVPYNLTNAEQFLDQIEPYKDNIDNLYFGIPSIGYGYHDFRMNKIEPDFNNLLQQEHNVYKFLKKVKAYINVFLQLIQVIFIMY